MGLKTDYKDDVFSGDRKYQKKDNSDGTISLVDKTAYSQKGDTFSAADINATNKAVNSLSAVATTSASGMMSAEDKSKLDNLQVGGRNLYLDTKNFDNPSVWSNYNKWSKTGEIYNGLTVIKCTSSWSGCYQEFAVKAGEVYTYSVYTKSNSDKLFINIIAGKDNEATLSKNEFDFKPSEEFTRQHCTFTVRTGGFIHPKVNLGSGLSENEAVEICGMKLERGTVATDWTPAPEDVENEIKAQSNVLDEYTPRPASANNIPGNDRKLKWFTSSSTMKEGQPYGSGYIIQFSWDGASWPSQLYIPSAPLASEITPQFRMYDGNKKEWGKWGNIYSEYHPQSSTTKSYTLSASSWSSGSYTISDSLITASSNQEVLPATSITADQMKALQKANIIDSGQSAESMTLKALGTVPTIDIPIRIIFRGTI